MAIEVLLVEDHSVVRQSIRAFLEKGEEFRVMGEVENGAEAIQFCRRSAPALVLMDVSMPGLNGIEATTEIVRHCPNTKVVVLSGFDDDVSVMNAIKAGARGYVLNRASLTDMLEAIRTVAKGGSDLSPQVSNRLLRRIQNGNGNPSPVSPVIQGLSPREIQVLRLVAQGKSSKEIAGVLSLELETVRSLRGRDDCRHFRPA